MRQAILGLATLVALLCASAANAAVITVSGSGVNPESPGITLLAEATFDTDTSGELKITLTNTGTYDAYRPTDILTAVFFSIKGNPTLTKGSAMLPTGSGAYQHVGSSVVDVTPADRIVGGEWAYNTGLIGAPGGAAQGISSTGLGFFGPGDRFPGPNLHDPVALNGLNYGITTASDDLSIHNGGNGKNPMRDPLIQNSVVFTLGLPTSISLDDISNVSFQYGTSLDEGTESPPEVPEPATLVIWSVLGLCFAGACRWRRRGGNMGRGGRGSAWSQDSVEAIHQIIDRGRLSR